MMKAVVTLLFATLLCAVCAAQTPDRPDEAGVIFLFDYNMHHASFRGLPGIPSCCPDYTWGDGAGYSIGLEYTRHLSDEFSLSARLFSADASVKFIDDENVFLSLDGQPVQGTFEHSLKATLHTLALEPTANYAVMHNMTVSVGVNLGILTTANFSQQEEAVSPPYAVFDTGTGSRVRKQLLFSGVLAWRMRIPVSGDRSLLLCPDISYLYTFSDVVKGLDWKPSALRAGIAVVKRL